MNPIEKHGAGKILPLLSVLALAAGQCGDEPKVAMGPDRNLESVVAEAIKLALWHPAEYFENRGPETIEKWGHLAFVEMDSEYAHLSTPELWDAAVAAMEGLRTTDDLGFEWFHAAKFEGMPGCLHPGLIKVRESVPEPRPPDFRGDFVDIVSVFPSWEEGGVIRVSMLTDIAPPRECPHETREGGTRKVVWARPTPKGWEFKMEVDPGGVE